MAKTNYQYEYHPADLRYLTQKLPVITSVAQTLNVSTLDVAAGIIREMNNERFVYPKDTVRWLGQPVKQLQVSELTDSSIRGYYDQANAMSRLKLENPSYIDRFKNPIFYDVGPGNIKIKTAIDQLRQYNESFPDSDPLDLKKYNRDYKAYITDLKDPSKDATIKVAGLIANEAKAFYIRNMGAAAWDALDEDRRAALAGKYYVVGREKMEDVAAAQQSSPTGDLYDPNFSGEGSDVYLYKSNPAALKRALGRQVNSIFDSDGVLTPDGKPAAFAPSGTKVDFGAIPLNGVEFASLWNGTSDASTRDFFPATAAPLQSTATAGPGAHAGTTVSQYQHNQPRSWRDTVVDSQNRPMKVLDRVDRDRVGNGQTEIRQVQEYARNGQPIGEPVQQGLGASGGRPGARPLGEFPPPRPEFYGDTPADERASDPGQIREADAVHEDAESPRQDEATDRAANRQQAVAAHLARIDQAKQRIPDFDRVIRAGGREPIAPGVADEILNSEKSALLQYHLAGNPAKLEELNGLSGKNLARAVGRIEGRLQLPPARTATEASRPLSDVRDSAAPMFDPHTTDDMDAFADWLREDQARRQRA